jgi:DNA-binding IclR family transcriptional regulator
MTTTARVLQVLRLFKEGRTVLRASDVEQGLGVSCATAYRYLADLEDAGLVERSAAGLYVLGPEVVELDRLVRRHDPLIAAAGDLMEDLAERTGGIVLLARLHSRRVMCVHQVRGPHAPQHVSYERGRAMPLYCGATSKAILAHLPREALRDLVRSDAAALREAGLPDDPEALQQAMAVIRQRKVCATVAEVDPGAQGWAAAIHHGAQLLGSLSVVRARGAPEIAGERVADLVLRAALRIQGRLESPRLAA